MKRVPTAVTLALLAAIAGSPIGAGDIPGARIVLEAAPVGPGRDAASAPPRFVLLEDDQVFVGGTELLDTGRLEKGEANALRKRAEQVRKIRGLASEVAFGGDPALRMRLRLLEEKVEIVVTGDPSQAPPPLAPLASLLADLLRFDHPSLRPWAPPTYAMVVREGRLVAGCRRWGFPFPIAAVLGAPRRGLPSAEAAGWPTGGVAASVCGADAGPRYIVALRPLLPGEQP